MQVEINIELTAEEWRRRYDRLKDVNMRLKATVEKYERREGGRERGLGEGGERGLEERGREG